MMKKWIKMLPVAVCIISLSACGTAGGDPTTESTKTDWATGESTAESTDVTTEAAETDTQQAATVQLPIGEEGLDMSFNSGAGGWSTELHLCADGSFTGEYHDSDMGDVGEGYPNGTVYVSSFSGNFTDIQKVDDTTYKMTLGGLEQSPVDTGIIDGILYVQSDAVGIIGGEEFWFYTPEAATAQFSEEFLGWWPGRYSDPAPDTLTVYGLRNVNEETGFFSAYDYGY